MNEVHAGLDTSVLLRLLVGRPDDQYQAALRFMDSVEESGNRLLVFQKLSGVKWLGG